MEKINEIEQLTFKKFFQFLSASHISATQKAIFMNKNDTEIIELMKGQINSAAFHKIMESRRLQMFQPLQNSYTKMGDKKILANTLGIKPSEVNKYISYITECVKEGLTGNISRETLELIKIYVYRHGKKNELFAFLDYELSSTNEILGVLYRTLQYNTGGVADYFIRPIHKMNNSTLVELYGIIDRNLKKAEADGNISKEDKERTAEWALVRIYEIQNNQKLKNALNLRKELNI